MGPEAKLSQDAKSTNIAEQEANRRRSKRDAHPTNFFGISEPEPALKSKPQNSFMTEVKAILKHRATADGKFVARIIV